MAQMCPPGCATRLQTLDKAAEAKTQPNVGSGRATPCMERFELLIGLVCPYRRRDREVCLEGFFSWVMMHLLMSLT